MSATFFTVSECLILTASFAVSNELFHGRHQRGGFKRFGQVGLAAADLAFDFV